ncbi:MAG: hypothetical protein WCT04_02435 [Planctomycetota bacterium]
MRLPQRVHVAPLHQPSNFGAYQLRELVDGPDLLGTLGQFLRIARRSTIEATLPTGKDKVGDFDRIDHRRERVAFRPHQTGERQRHAPVEILAQVDP